MEYGVLRHGLKNTCGLLAAIILSVSPKIMAETDDKNDSCAKEITEDHEQTCNNLGSLPNCSNAHAYIASTGCVRCECTCNTGYVANADRTECVAGGGVNGGESSLIDVGQASSGGDSPSATETAKFLWQCAANRVKQTFENAKEQAKCNTDHARANTDRMTLLPRKLLTCNGNMPDVRQQVVEEHSILCSDFGGFEPDDTGGFFNGEFRYCINEFNKIAAYECTHGVRNRTTSSDSPISMTFSSSSGISGILKAGGGVSVNYDRSAGTDFGCSAGANKVQKLILEQYNKCKAEVRSNNTQQRTFSSLDVPEFNDDEALSLHQVPIGEVIDWYQARIITDELDLLRDDPLALTSSTRFNPLAIQPGESAHEHLWRMAFLYELSHLYREKDFSVSQINTIEAFFRKSQKAHIDFSEELFNIVWKARKTNEDTNARTRAITELVSGSHEHRFVALIEKLDSEFESYDFYRPKRLLEWWMGSSVFSTIKPMFVFPEQTVD